MKKMILLPLILSLTAVGCGRVAPKADTAGLNGAVPTESDTVPEKSETSAAEPVSEAQDEDSFEFEVRDGSAVITKYTGTSNEIDVPEQLDGVPVTEIGFYAFEAKFDITAIALPETVSLIGEGAFMDCSSLVSINIPDAVTGIDRGAFVGCSKLETLRIPENITYIQEEAFTGCGSLRRLEIMNPDLAYENWGLEDIPELTVYAPDGSSIADWAYGVGIAYETF